MAPRSLAAAPLLGTALALSIIAAHAGDASSHAGASRHFPPFPDSHHLFLASRPDLRAYAAGHTPQSRFHASHPLFDDLTWIKGVNYVPSTSHNDIGTLIDYDFAIVEEELGWLGNGTTATASSGNAANFNMVRLFLHSLPYFYNATRFFEVLDHFVATSAANGMKPFLVVLDSCFGDVNADLSWITSGKYKNFTWIPNPGPAIVANTSAWSDIDVYVSALVSRYAEDERILGWDVMNEPDFGDVNILEFLDHYATLIQAIDTMHIVTMGIAYAGQQSMTPPQLRTLSFHSYDGGNGGGDFASIIASQQAFASNVSKAVFVSESMSRPNDLLPAVLLAASGCLGPNAPIGITLWEGMLGVDQFNYNWSYPYQGLIFPSAAGPQLAGTWWSAEEQGMWANFTGSDGGAWSCPWTPVQNYTWVADTDASISYTPAGAWTAWQGAGPRDGTLHYANTANAQAEVRFGGGPSQLTLVHKMGPDCGIMQVYLDGVLAASKDTYSPAVDWGHELVVGSGLPGGNVTHTVLVNCTGGKNPASSDTYVQVVGFEVFH